MRIALASVFAALALTSVALADSFSSVNHVDANGNTITSPKQGCQLSAAINISTATTTQLIAGVAGQNIYVCSIIFSATGTTPTAQFTSGTGGTCGTSTVTLSGVIIPPAFFSIVDGNSTVLGIITAGQGFCLVSGGTPSLQGWIEYSQF